MTQWLLFLILIIPSILSKRSHIEVLKSYSPSLIGDDMPYNSVSKVVQEIKKSIIDSDPTLAPVVQLRKLFFETLVRPVHTLELEYNQILGKFVILRNKFKDYIDIFLEFDTHCTNYVNSKEIQSPHQDCTSIMPSLLQHIDSMVDVVDEIMHESKLEDRIYDILSALSKESKRIQEMEQERRNQYKKMWTLNSIDLKGFKESLDQILNMDSFLQDFRSSFHKFKVQLQTSKNALSGSYTAINIEVKMEEDEVVPRKQVIQKLLDFLWKQNEVSYLSLKTIVEPDIQSILVQLPKPEEKDYL